MSETREPGFYWVKFKSHGQNGTWSVGEFTGEEYKLWNVIGSDEIFDTEELIVGPKIEIPEGF